MSESTTAVAADRPITERTRRGAGALQRHGLTAAIMAGGATGALMRFGIDRVLPVEAGHWPWPTFLANMIGCLMLGYFATRLLERLPPSTYRRPLLGTGLCGALTTFSSMQVEALTLGRGGHGALAAVYVVVSVVAGLGCVGATTAMVRRARLSHG